MIGRFEYRKNCSISHHIPQGMTANGCPVIVFPQHTVEAVVGTTYEFDVVMTKKATYTIDGVVYRVGHAVSLRDVEGKGGDIVDRIVHSSSAKGRHMPLSSLLDPEVRGKLEALKASLARSDG